VRAQFTAAQKQSLRRRLLAWYAKHARDLPWRQSRDPYRVWVSEIMLQQTQVATVEPYFRRFVDAFPTVARLAAADEQAVLRLWEGLGYYRRARQLHKAAQAIIAEHGGKFPSAPDEVRRLPGIGRYTAGAILSIAFDARQPILEANTVRLLSRLSAYRGDAAKAEGQRHLWQLAEDLLPQRKVGSFNQALMELGSLVCTPRNPRCEACPLVTCCAARAAGLQNEIPRAKKKPVFEDVREAAIVVRRGPRVLLLQRRAGERWAGMWDFPRFGLNGHGDTPARLREELVRNVREQTGVTIAPLEQFTTLKHGVTRFRITLDCYAARYVSGPSRGHARRLQWLRPAALDEVPLCMTGRKIGELIQR
jgi:A/G-specific adenine glycosylase